MLRKLKPPKPKLCEPTTLDIEVEDGRLLAIGLAYFDKHEVYYVRFDTWDEWLDWLIDHVRKNRKLTKIFAHNGANFDWLCLVEHFKGDLSALKVIQAGSSYVGINIELRGLKIRLRDSLKLFPASLAKLCKAFGVATPKLDIGVKVGELYRDNRPLFEEYLRIDCLSLQQVLIALHTKIEEKFGPIGELPMTGAGLSLRVFQTCFLEHDIMVPWNKQLKQLSEDCLHGGYVFAPQPYVGRVEEHDINSMYAFVMRNGLFPTGEYGGWTDTFDEYNLGLYEGYYSQPLSSGPPIIFDVDRDRWAYNGRAKLTSVEVKYLKGLGGSFEVVRGYVFLRCGPLFQSFCDACYAFKREAEEDGDGGLREIAKFLPNSLFGKLGQKSKRSSTVLLTPDVQRKLLESGANFRDHGDFAVVEEDVDCEYQFAAISAFVTAYARVFWHKTAARIGWEDVVYGDTDSFHVKAGATLPDGLEGVELGQTKLAKVGQAAFAGKKSYAYRFDNGEELVRHKGVTIAKVGDVYQSGFKMGYSEMVEIVYGRVIEATFERAPTGREVLLLQKKAGKWLRRVRKIRATAGV